MPGHKKGSIGCPAFMVKPGATMHFHGMAGKMGMQMNEVSEVEDEHESESESVSDHESFHEQEEDMDLVVEREMEVKKVR